MQQCRSKPFTPPPAARHDHHTNRVRRTGSGSLCDGGDLSDAANWLRGRGEGAPLPIGAKMSQRKGNISALIAHIAVGQTLAQSAAAAGMSVKTAQRRLHEPQVRTAITAAQADLTRHDLARFRGLRDQAMDRVSQILANDGAGWSAHLRAAELILRHAAAADNAWVVDEIAAQAHDIALLQENLGAVDD